MKKRAKCIATGCEGETGFSGAARGLCVAHYRAACRLVRGGRTTWVRLEKAGKTRSSTFKRISWFDGAIDAPRRVS